MASVVKTKEDIEYSKNILEKAYFSLVNKGRKRPVREGEATFLGEIDGPKRKESRTLFRYER